MTGAGSKEEIRAARRGLGSAAGNAAKELEVLDRLQSAEGDSQSAIITITVGCTTYGTIICCRN